MSDDPRTWGNCIRRTDLPPITGDCKWNGTEPCLHPARTWKWMPQGGWYPLCYAHADYLAQLDRAWNDAEDEYLGR